MTVKLLVPNARSLDGLPAGSKLWQAEVSSDSGPGHHGVSILRDVAAKRTDTYCSCRDGWITAFKEQKCKHVVAVLEEITGRTKEKK